MKRGLGLVTLANNSRRSIGAFFGSAAFEIGKASSSSWAFVTRVFVGVALSQRARPMLTAYIVEIMPASFSMSRS